MNRAEVIELAKQATHEHPQVDYNQFVFVATEEMLERFAAEVERRTLERAAKVCEDDFGNGALNLAAAIRALGEKQ